MDIFWKFLVIKTLILSFISYYFVVVLGHTSSILIINYALYLFSFLIFTRSKIDKQKLLLLISIDVILPLISLIIFSTLGMTNWLMQKAIKKKHLDRPFINKSFQDYTLHLNTKISNNTHLSINIHPKNEKYIDLRTYADILYGDNLKLKINAIEKLFSIKTKKSISLLKNALNDKTYEVSYFSKLALEKIENEIIKDIDKITKKVVANPNNILLIEERADLYFWFYQSGLLDDYTGLAIIEKALFDYLYVLQIATSHNTYFKIIDIYLVKKDYVKVIKYCKALSSLINDDDSSSQILNEKLAISYYQLNNIKEFNKVISKSSCKKDHLYYLNESEAYL